jgi:hypothetical protein
MEQGACYGNAELHQLLLPKSVQSRGNKTSEVRKAEAENKKAVLELCGNCPVRLECLRYGLEEEVTGGVWGGVDFSREGTLRVFRSYSKHYGLQSIQDMYFTHGYQGMKSRMRKTPGVKPLRGRANG